jgi:hypothetical protein
MRANYVSTPKRTIMTKKHMHQRLARGISDNEAGYMMNVRSGPYKGISLIGTPII